MMSQACGTAVIPAHAISDCILVHWPFWAFRLKAHLLILKNKPQLLSLADQSQFTVTLYKFLICCPAWGAWEGSFLPGQAKMGNLAITLKNTLQDIARFDLFLAIGHREVISLRATFIGFDDGQKAKE
jgi:hypothetical protein